LAHFEAALLARRLLLSDSYGLAPEGASGPL
jgi:hypothetical protein